MTQIASVGQLFEVLDKRIDPDLTMFRGQTRDWPLLPSIGRYHRDVQRYPDWRAFHDDMIYRFLRLGHPYFSGHAINGTDCWVLAQHHGLPTRLLDTTTNPLKALFFAVSYPTDDAQNGVLWVISYSGWREELTEEYRSFWEKEVVPFAPAQLNPRLTAQEGAFVSYPLPKNRKPLRPMNKIKKDLVTFRKLVIPAAAKAALREQLAVLGIQYRFLFPDLDGVARSIKLTELES